jgi:putative membrane protein
MGYFDHEFEEQLTDIVEEIESVSKIEMVVVIRQKSGNYTHATLLTGAAFSLIAFTYFMFSPTVFGDYMIYIGSIIPFFVGAVLTMLIPALSKVILGKTAFRKNTEIRARATFQKAGIRHTQEKIGLLIYGSAFEKELVLLADKGVELLLSDETLKTIEDDLQTAFRNGTCDQFLKVLHQQQKIFSEQLPISSDDINELPDTIDVKL